MPNTFVLKIGTAIVATSNCVHAVGINAIQNLNPISMVIGGTHILQRGGFWAVFRRFGLF